MSREFRYWWEDFLPGRVFAYGRRALSEDEIIEFARQWDPQRFHIDPPAARETPFGGIVASGWHTGCVLMRLMCDAYLNESSCIGSPGIDEWRFAAPVRPGDALRFRATVLESGFTTKTAPSCSLVTYTTRPSGWRATPSGSLPTRTCPRSLPLETSTIESCAVSSFET